MPTYAAEADYTYGSGGIATIRIECTIPTLTEAMTSMTLTAVGKLISNYGLSDSTNGYSYTGDGVADESGTNKAISHGGSGGTTTFGSATQSHALSYTATKTVSVTFKITNIDAVGSTMTVTRSVTIPKRLADVPSTPAAPTITGIGATGATVNWVAPASNGASLDGYDLQWSTSSTFASGVTTTFHADAWATSKVIPATLLKATTYYARVRATNAEGNSAYSAGKAFTTLATVPDPPTSSPGSLTPTSAVITITDGDNGGAAVTGREVVYSLSSTFTSPTTLTTTSLTRAITGLIRNTVYWVKSRSINSVGPSADGPAVSFTTSKTVPTAPLSPSVTSVGPNSANLAYTTPTDNGGEPIMTYTVQRSLSNTFSSPTNQSTGSLTPLVTGLTPNTLYYFRVQAVNAQGAGAWSATFSGTTTAGTPGVPQALTTTDLQADQASFSWSPPASDGGSALIGYRGYLTDVTLGGSPVGFDIANVTTLTLFSLTHSHQYTLTIAARNAVGVGSPTSTVTITTLNRTPLTAVAPTFSAVTSNGFTVTAAVPSDNGGSAITSYVAQLALNSGFTGDIIEVTDPTRVMPVMSLLPGTTYYVRTAAVNAYGRGDWSTTGNQGTVAGFSGVLGATVGLVGESSLVASGEIKVNVDVKTISVVPGAASSDAPLTIPNPLKGVAESAHPGPVTGLLAVVTGIALTHRQAPDLRVSVGLVGQVKIEAILPIPASVSDTTPARVGGPRIVNVGLVGTLTPRPYGDQTLEPELYDMLEVLTLESLPLDEPLEQAGFDPVLPSLVTLNVVKGH